MTDFKALLRVLSESGVEFILVGGVAATVHGSTRLTADVDVVYERRRPNLDRLALALTPYHPYLRGAPPGLPFRWDAQTLERGLNFTLTTDLIVETSWGTDLGKVLNHGTTQPLAGEPRPLAGVARARYVYAPVAGVFRTALQIGSPVRAGAPVAYVGATVLTAPLDGVLRGLTHDRVPVTVGTKVIEVDPRGPAAVVRGIGERPGTIAAGVLRAVQAWVEQRARQTG